MVLIEKNLLAKIKEALIKCLQHNIMVFTWIQKDMLGTKPQNVVIDVKS